MQDDKSDPFFNLTLGFADSRWIVCDKNYRLYFPRLPHIKVVRWANKESRYLLNERYDMLLCEYNKSDHPRQSNPGVKCNALYKTRENVNCYLTPTQAITLARNLLEKVQLILDENLEDTAVQLWNQGKENERLYCGLIQARKGPRKGRSRSKSTSC